jgi:hypothetical protein
MSTTTTDPATTAPTTVTAVATVATPARPADSTLKGLPWFIMGATVLLVALGHLDKIPEWISFQTPDGVLGSITGMLILLGIAATLITVGINKRRG